MHLEVMNPEIVYLVGHTHQICVMALSPMSTWHLIEKGDVNWLL